MNMLLWLVLLLAAASQGLFLLVHFLIRAGQNRLAGRLLCGLLGVMLCVLLGNIWVAAGLYRQWPTLPGYFRGMVLLLGPLCYLYASALLLPGFRLRPLHLLHLAPWVIAFAMARMQEMATPAAGIVGGIDQLIAGEAPVTGWYLTWYAGYLLQLSIYFVLLRRILRRLSLQPVATYQVPIAGRLAWLKRLERSFLLLLAVFTIILVYILVTGYYTIIGNFIYTLALSVWVYVLAWQSMNSRGVLFAGFTGKYQHTKLGDALKDRLISQLRLLLEQERIYTDAQLTLAKAAGRLGVAPHLLSQAINDALHNNFNDLLHEYRIEAFKQLAMQPPYSQYTIMAIAAEAGYTNRASFNAAFRKRCGVTPSEWLRQME
jgi:AraC-like DNA-binding protein